MSRYTVVMARGMAVETRESVPGRNAADAADQAARAFERAHGSPPDTIQVTRQETSGKG